MRGLLLVMSIFLPVAGGIILMLRPTGTEMGRRIWCEAFTIASSVCVWLLLFGGRLAPFALYSFTRGFALTLHSDGLSMLFAGMVSLMWPFVTLFAYEYMNGVAHRNAFLAFYLITYGFTLGMAFSGDALTLYVFFEMLSLITIPLVTFNQDHESMYSGRLYAGYVIAGAAIGFIPVVVTTMYGAGPFTYGGHSFSAHPQGLIGLMFLCAFFGFGVKAAVFPQHRWLPAATVAPTPVTALLHAVAVVNSGVFAIMRMVWYVFSPEAIEGTWAHHIALGTAIFTLVFAAVCAVRERHFKKRLAYSTISNLSYMLYGVLLLNAQGLRAGMAHMLFHGVIKMSLFLCAGAFLHETGCAYIYQINGAGRKMPRIFVFYTCGALSLTGVPMFCGFISKWNLLLAGASSGTILGYTGMAALIVSAFLCAIYTISVSIRAFFPMAGTDRWKGTDLRDPNWRMIVPIGLFTAANIYFGLFPMPILTFLGKVAEGIL